jgi:predicted enzyme related to lactoylglutathione lyase
MTPPASQALGGKIHHEPVDIPGGYGRVANLADLSTPETKCIGGPEQ